MPISFSKEKSLFHLQGTGQSYLIYLYDNAYLMHLYWGRRLGDPDFIPRPPYRRAARLTGHGPDDVQFSAEYWQFEFPPCGTGDFRLPALKVRSADTGGAVTDLRYQGHRIYPGKPALEGLPGAYCDAAEEAETLEIDLLDRVTGLRALLRYTLFHDTDVITRHMVLKNTGGSALQIEEAMSASVDFEQGEFRFLSLNGTALREHVADIRPVLPGVLSVDSTRGTSSHQHSPMFALLREGADNRQGEVYGFSLLYSGSFTARVEMDMYRSLRAQIGINPAQFSWKLSPGESFSVPETALCFSAQGLNGLSRELHSFVRGHIIRGPWRDRERPVLLNSWEACYFDFNEEKLLNLAKKAKDAGIELLVMDDGWFGEREDDSSSLGDWVCNERKLPRGLGPLVEKINGMGLRFGIWFEPEMVSPRSRLYREHPDWCIHAPGRKRTEWRNQLVLDLANPQVCDYLVNSLSAILCSSNIEYVKWDHNRRLCDLGSAYLSAEQQPELSHRYLLGLYSILERLTKAFPHVLFENCASGGGRHDYGMFCYFQQGWLTDNTDPVCRLAIQDSASVFFPPVSMTAHVSASPNHQTGRATPISFRADVAALFNFGYELDATRFSEEEGAAVRSQIDFIKRYRDAFAKGAFYRLNSLPGEAACYGWQTVSADESLTAAGFYRPFCQAEEAYWILRLEGLCPDARYLCENDQRVYSGDQLMYRGLEPDWHGGDFFSEIFILRRI